MPNQLTATDAAVILTCDEKYLPYALHLAWQTANRCPARQFDILICSETALDLPDLAVQRGIRAVTVARAAWIDDLPTARLGRATYLRLAMPEQMRDRYRRLLYLDCDVFLESGDLDRLIRIPMGDCALAAVRDINWVNDPAYHAQEFRAQGLGPLPYFNAGVMVIDTAAFVAGDLRAQGVALAKHNPDIMRIQDQSLLNAVVKGRFAELAPGWNWMANAGLPFALHNVPIRFRHFIGPVKPWSDPQGRYDRRFHDSYADFFRCLLPDDAPPLAPRPPSGLTGLDAAVRLVIAQARKTKRLEAVLRRFTDEWEVKLPGNLPA